VRRECEPRHVYFHDHVDWTHGRLRHACHVRTVVLLVTRAMNAKACFCFRFSRCSDLIDLICSHNRYRYMEVPSHSREEKTKTALETIGASVLVGGLSTLLGVVPLGFSSSTIFFTVFVVFFGLVLLGLLHGLVLLPVLLSMMGPVVIFDDDDASSKQGLEEDPGTEKAGEEESETNSIEV